MTPHSPEVASIFRKLEHLLLEPSVEARKAARDALLHNGGVPHLEEVTNIIMYATECDVYRGILALDRAVGKNLLIDVDVHSDCESSQDLFDHLTVRLTGFLQSDVKNGLEPLYVLAGCVMLLNIFMRVNWTGPPVGVVSSTDKHLALQYSKKVLDHEQDSYISLDTLDHMPTDATAFSAYASMKVADEFSRRCFLKSPDTKGFDVIGDKSNYSLFMANIIETLEVDGEGIYTGISGAPYLVAAITFLATINGSMEIMEGSDKKQDESRRPTAQLTTVGVWQARIAFTWQRIVRSAMFNPCQTLFKCCIRDYGEILKSSGILPNDFSLSLYDEELLKSVDIGRKTDLQNHTDPSLRVVRKQQTLLERVIAKECISPVQCSQEMGSMLIVELALRLPYYNMNKLCDPLLDAASSLIGFRYSFTGRLGIRRKYQVRQIAQLVLLREDKNQTAATEQTSTAESNDKETDTFKQTSEERDRAADGTNKDAAPAPENIGLLDVNDDTDILERPKLSEEAEDSPLTVSEQCILLSKALHILHTAPEDDELNLEFLNAIVVRCLGTQHNGISWLLSSVALWVRCKTEYHRTKTVERATLQLYKLSDSYYEGEITAANRLEYMWHTWCPSSWGIKREICRRMCSIGSFLTAYEIYRKLHLWEDAIQCLIIVGRKSDAKDLVMTQLKVAETPLLWCFLGDIEGNMSHYNKAWDLSKGRCARAQRTLGSYYFNKGDLDKAVESLELALAINPMRESSQFLLGCAYLKQSNLERAIGVFARVVALNPASHDAWANMCSGHMNMGKLKEAGLCIEQAVKHCPNKWQFWEMRMSISIRARDVQGVCLSIDKLIQLGKQSSVTPPVVAFLVDASTHFIKVHSTQRMIARTLDNVTRHITEDHDIWSLCARYFSFQKFYDEALECTLRQYRAIEKRIAGSLAEVKPDAEQQRDHDVTHMRRLTSCLGDAVALLKRLPPSHRREKRDTIVQTLKSVRERFRARTDKVNEQFLAEMDSMIENADVEDVIAVYGDE